MALPDRADAENEPATALGRAGLIGMEDDARVEQGRRLEGILEHEIRADELALRRRDGGVGRERVADLFGAGFEPGEGVAMPIAEDIRHLRQLTGGGTGVERQDPLDQPAETGLDLVRGIIAVGRGGERKHDHTRRIGAHVETLTEQAHWLRRRAAVHGDRQIVATIRFCWNWLTRAIARISSRPRR